MHSRLVQFQRARVHTQKLTGAFDDSQLWPPPVSSKENAFDSGGEESKHHVLDRAACT